MTEKLYYADQYLAHFLSRVVSCEETRGGFAVVLEKTAFYPEGGGQPGDTGSLGGVRVLDTHERGGKVVHLCSAPLEPGAEVEGLVDWARRFDLMQQHSGEHIVSGLIHARFGYENVGFHIGAETVTIDFSGELTRAQLSDIERAANERIWRNDAVVISWPAPAELETIAYRSKKALTGPVRIVEFPDADVCACCGTHVARTGEIGLILLLSCQRFHEGVRIEMLSGRRAYEYAARSLEQGRLVSAALSAKSLELAPAVERMKSELEAEKYRLYGCEQQLFERIAAGCGNEKTALVFQPGLTPDGVRRLCAALTDAGAGLAAVFSGADSEGFKYAVGSADGDIRALVKDMNTALNGSGGGKSGFAQGSVQCSRPEIEAFFAAMSAADEEKNG